MSVTCYKEKTQFGTFHMPSAGASRQQLYRQRKKQGFRCIRVEIRHTEVQELVRRGLLGSGESDTFQAIRTALYRHLDRTLSPIQRAF